MSKRLLIGSVLLACVTVAGVALAAGYHESREHRRHESRIDRHDDDGKYFGRRERDHHGDRRGRAERGERGERGHRGDTAQGVQPNDAPKPLPDTELFKGGKRPQVEIR